ncbi:MAG: acyl carrier protein [Nitrospirae bacterium]|nr:acyl carrier protein [Nitrospirota bacterium]MBF0553596.1 acyl carrier protein [Nitrospirota bacterium]
MKERIKQILASVFGIDPSDINDDSSPENIEEWDSLKHMNMILALEEEFQIRFTNEEVIELISCALIESMIKEKLAET